MKPINLLPSSWCLSSLSLSKGSKAIIYHLSFIILFFSCKPTQTTTHDRIVKDSTIIREIPRIIEVPGQTIQSPSINIDSLVTLIQNGIKPEVINQTLISTDTTGRLQARLIIDQLGNLTALCEQQEQMINYLEQQVTHWKSEYEKETITIEPTFWQKLKGSLDIIAFTIVATLIAMLLTRLIRPT